MLSNPRKELAGFWQFSKDVDFQTEGRGGLWPLHQQQILQGRQDGRGCTHALIQLKKKLPSLAYNRCYKRSYIVQDLLFNFQRC